MADVTVKVLEPATSFALMTLAEAKLALGIPTGDTANDAQLQWQIDLNSATVAELCNRVFAKEKVRESWRCLYPYRIFLTHWPVKEEDIESITAGGLALTPGDWELEEESGKVLLFSSKAEPIVVTYTGGFALPDEAPLPLKQATGLLVGLTRSEQQQAELSGIRMIAHKEKRIMFHAPSSGGSSSSGGGSQTGARTAAQTILSHYTRHWV